MEIDEQLFGLSYVEAPSVASNAHVLNYQLVATTNGAGKSFVHVVHRSKGRMKTLTGRVRELQALFAAVWTAMLSSPIELEMRTERDILDSLPL